jgi:hypothetical protein
VAIVRVAIVRVAIVRVAIVRVAIVRVAIVRVAIFLGGNCPGWQLSWVAIVLGVAIVLSPVNITPLKIIFFRKKERTSIEPHRYPARLLAPSDGHTWNRPDGTAHSSY